MSKSKKPSKFLKRQRSMSATTRRSRPSHVKACYQVERHVQNVLESTESILDISFRGFSTKMGPAGWSVVIDFGGEAAGFTIPIFTRPTASMLAEALRGVRSSVEEARKRAEKRSAQEKLSPKPGEIERLAKKKGLIDG